MYMNIIYIYIYIIYVCLYIYYMCLNIDVCINAACRQLGIHILIYNAFEIC
jgi:hypothetical protein